MEKIKCEDCGKEVTKKNAIVWFSPDTSHASNLCIGCYYIRLAGMSTAEICQAMARRTKDDNRQD